MANEAEQTLNWAKAFTGLGEDVKASGRLIGGLLYQQEQTAADRLYAADEKRKDRLYSEKLLGEKIGRETSAATLKGAQGALGKVYENARDNWKVLSKQYYKHNTDTSTDTSGLPVAGGLSQEQLADMKEEMERLWEISQDAKEQYLRAHSIKFIREKMPDVDEIAEEEAKFGISMDNAIDSAIEGTSDTQLDAMLEKLHSGEEVDFEGYRATINGYRADAFKAQEAKKENFDLAPAYVKEQSHMSDELWQQTKKTLRVKLKALSKDARKRIRMGEFNAAANPRELPDAYELDKMEWEGHGLRQADPGKGDISSGGEKYSSMTPRGEMMARSRDRWLHDTQFVSEAEKRARERAENKGARESAAKAPRGVSGMISAMERGGERSTEEAYQDATEIITALLQQFPTGDFAQKTFTQILGEIELSETERLAFQQAFQDLFGVQPSGMDY